MDKKSNYITYGSFIFSVVYIFLEITFNLGLVDFINSKNTELNVFHGLETLGRTLSSIGFSLFLVKVLLRKLKTLHVMAPVIMFILTGVIFYSAQTVIFNKIVDNLSNQQKFDSYSLGVYRNLSLNGQIKSSLFNNEDPYYDQVINSMLILVNNNIETKNKINKDIQNFFKINYEVDSTTLGSIFDKINHSKVSSSENLHDYYKLYYIESKRYENYHGFMRNKYKENFVKTIGIEPSLSEEEFVAAFKEKQANKQAVNWNNIIIVPANKQIHMSELTVGQIPDNLTKEQWINFVNKHVTTSIDKLRFNVENVENFPHVKNIISSVIISPIAIILSLLSILLNISLLIKGKIKYVFMSFFVIAGLLFSYNPYQINNALNKFAGLESYMVHVLTPYKQVIHRAFINDTNPNAFNIVRVERPVVPDLKSESNKAEEQFNELIRKNNSVESNVKKDNETYIDDKKMKQDNYYGELNKKNPYAK